MSHIFYSLPENDLEIKKQILIDGHSKSYKWWVDILVEWRREIIKMSFEDILNKLDDESLFFIVLRKPILNNYIELGFTTMKKDEPKHYLWIYCSESYLDYFIDKYKLIEKV